MLRFHVTIQGAGEQAPLAVGFEVARERLEVLPRMFIEPDGSFVWTGMTKEDEAWQVDGNLIDRGDVLAYVELKGGCPSERLDALLRALSWPEAKVVFQLVRTGVVVEEGEFRRVAETEEGAV
jgi:hypothetical protein